MKKRYEVISTGKCAKLHEELNSLVDEGFEIVSVIQDHLVPLTYEIVCYKIVDEKFILPKCCGMCHNFDNNSGKCSRGKGFKQISDVCINFKLAEGWKGVIE